MKNNIGEQPIIPVSQKEYTSLVVSQKLSSYKDKIYNDIDKRVSNSIVSLSGKLDQLKKSLSYILIALVVLIVINCVEYHLNVSNVLGWLGQMLK